MRFELISLFIHINPRYWCILPRLTFSHGAGMKDYGFQILMLKLTFCFINQEEFDKSQAVFNRMLDK